MPIASNSSKKMTPRPILRAWAKISRTRFAPTPTYFSTNSEPDAWWNGTPASAATARASIVLPVPGGPYSMIPRGIRAPSLWNRSGVRRNSIVSVSSSFASSQPATSARRIVDGGAPAAELSAAVVAAASVDGVAGMIVRNEALSRWAGPARRESRSTSTTITPNIASGKMIERGLGPSLDPDGAETDIASSVRSLP